MSKKSNKALNIFLIIIYFMFILFPLYWILTMSVKDPKDIMAYPPKFLFNPIARNYLYITGMEARGVGIGGQTSKGMGGHAPKEEFMQFFLNSVIIVTGAITLTVIVGVPAAYALARYEFPLKENIAFTFLSFRFAPLLTVIIPLYLIYQRLNLYNTYQGLILAYQLITLPLVVWIMRGFFEEIPKEIGEAAVVDGCGFWSRFFRVELPLVTPGLAASVVLASIFAWNDFPLALILAGQQTKPVTIGILGFIGYEEVQWGPMAAGIIVAILPSLILSLFVQRYMVRGLTFGAIKG